MANNFFGDYDRYDDRPRGRAYGRGRYEYTEYGRETSQGPQINVYNRVDNDQQQRPSAAPPAPAPPPPPPAQPAYPPQPIYAQPPYMAQYAPPAPPPNFFNIIPPYAPAAAPAPARRSPSPARHRYHGLGEDLVEDLAEMHLGHGRSQSRARAEFDRQAERQAALNEYKLAEREQMLKDLQLKAEYEKENRRIRDEIALKRMHEDDERRREEERKEAEFKARMLKAEAKARDDAEAAKLKEKLWADDIIEDMERKEKEKEEEEKRLIRELEYRKQAQKEKEEKMWKELEAKKKAEKEAEEAREKEYERKLKEKEEKKKADEKAAKEKADRDFRDRLRAMGYSEHHIDGMMAEDKDKKTVVDVHQTNVNIYRPPSMMLTSGQTLTFPKIRREYLAAETLAHFNLKWEYDRDNDDYIIILRHLTREETELLFEHTRRLRAGTLLIESSGSSKKKHEYAWVRHRSKSRNGRGERVGILELK
ncbi:uncharacterized protein K489DRAFT_108610 [Dissoconium aciculare CBS 342.82]|uniref:Uncharacterized protein n=1 Tax=Dissoconium aciculare CBS 342.82 TaxID=1314786 RepID=A0A6J3MEW7_9PEZI|nr:uncharacterized protein K489DRAFT_108610 [Dissoconium aciculare CBS 342.82]KAF1826169.1 hypothetical protein K489DRAFT_108610 [Dissoconium aciculare CBS 342.82]